MSPHYASVQAGRGGCRNCAGQVVEADDAVAVMRAAGLEPLEPNVNSLHPWRWRCTVCGSAVTPRHAYIRKGGGRRRNCATYGFDHESPAHLYVLTDPVRGAHKVGVAGLDTTRLNLHSRRGWQVYRTLRFEGGEDAYQVEQAILRWWRDDLGLPPYLAECDGWTETVDAEAVHLPTLWRKVLALSRMDTDDSSTDGRPAPR